MAVSPRASQTRGRREVDPRVWLAVGLVLRREHLVAGVEWKITGLTQNLQVDPAV
jgi:hypothetical protein